PPPYTVPRSRRGLGRVFTTGLLPNGDFASEYPLPLTPELLHRGRDGFEAYCAACHGLLGDGESQVSRNMALRPPPSLLTLPEYAPGYWYTVISEGFGLMPGYADKLSPAERWAVAAYVEALRYSQSVPVEELPEDVRSRLEAQP
ncbi:MAG TPA: cytochrome c, partial [Myxococcaceae bacterium]|nr:cytochrome c [Myxococcaceae bacterium]